MKNTRHGGSLIAGSQYTLNDSFEGDSPGCTK
jgi:hypothetical protein